MMVQVQKTVDGWFTKIQNKITEKIGSFVAVQFLLIALGAWLGISVARIWPDQVILAVIVPAFVGLVAYYNRAFATAMFVIMLVAIFII